jgi:hypothetical protein
MRLAAARDVYTSEAAMNRTLANFVTDLLSFFAMCGALATGLLIKYILPPRSGGMGRGGGLMLWGWNRHDWGDLHFYFTLALLGLLLVHVTLHWHWVAGTAARFASSLHPPARSPRRSARHVAVASFIALAAIGVGGFLWAASQSVDRHDGARASGRRGWAAQADAAQSQSGAEPGDADGRGSGGGWRGGRWR